METKKVRSSMTLVLIMVMSLFATLEFSDRAEGSEIVVTDAIQIVAVELTTTEWLQWMPTQWVTRTSYGESTQHLYYKMLDPRGEVLIDEPDPILAHTVLIIQISL